MHWVPWVAFVKHHLAAGSEELMDNAREVPMKCYDPTSPCDDDSQSDGPRAARELRELQELDLWIKREESAGRASEM